MRRTAQFEPYLRETAPQQKTTSLVDFAHDWVIHPIATAAGAFLHSLAVEPPIKPGAPDPYTPPKPGEWQPQTSLQIGPIIQFVTTLAQTHDEPQPPHHGIEHQAG